MASTALPSRTHWRAPASRNGEPGHRTACRAADNDRSPSRFVGRSRKRSPAPRRARHPAIRMAEFSDGELVQREYSQALTEWVKAYRLRVQRPILKSSLPNCRSVIPTEIGAQGDRVRSHVYLPMILQRIPQCITTSSPLTPGNSSTRAIVRQPHHTYGRTRRSPYYAPTDFVY